MIQDSIQHVAKEVAVEEVAETGHVLQAQTDSAAQSVYSAKVSHWPVHTDSLLMPDIAKDIKVEVKPLPKYYKDSFFAKDSLLLHSELQGGRYGIAGDPVPYTVRNDSPVTLLLIFSFLMLLLCVSRSTKFVRFQLRNFFRTVRSGSILERESASENRYLLISGAHTAVMLTLMFFFYAKMNIADTFITYSEYTLMAIFLGVIVAFMIMEFMLFSVINPIFFATEDCDHWRTSKMLSLTVMGVLLSPVFLLTAYFGMETEKSLLLTLYVIIFVKIALFYKCFLIFFKRIGAIVQFFLYFCTLEIIPPLILWGVLLITANYLKVIY